MKLRIQLAALAAVVSITALPLRAQDAVVSSAAVRADSIPAARPMRAAAIVVTAERVDERERLLRLERGNRFLANELRMYDRRAEALASRLEELKEVAARREAEIRAIDARRDAARVERAKLEARLMTLEQSGGAAMTTTAAKGAGGA